MLLATFPSQDPRVVIQREHCSLLMKITHIHHVKRQLRSVPPLSGKSCTILLVQHTHTKHLQNFSLVRLEFWTLTLHYVVNIAFSYVRKMFSFPLMMPLQHQDKHWGEVNLVGSYQQHLSGIQPTLHNCILYFRQSNLMCGKTVGERVRERERKEKKTFYYRVSLSSPQVWVLGPHSWHD